jgi:RNA polymerase sigma factor (sigma-70 family)
MALRHLRRLALPCDGGVLTDGQLLERFLATRDEAAFGAIVRRHGPTVLGVCRRVLPGVQGAEDAFQATFLVLVHKAASVSAHEAIGSWLYSVAYRTACKARVAAARRRAKEVQMVRHEAQHEPDNIWEELRPLIDQELSRLPEKYRAPIVLCDLQGQTRKQAARQLDCPEGTVSGRLSRGRSMLAKRLARRGLALATGAVASALSQGAASADLEVPLVESTIRAATCVAAGNLTAGGVSVPVAVLTQGVLKSMATIKLKLSLALLLALGVLGTGWGVYSSGADDTPRQIQAPAQANGGGGAVAPSANSKLNLPSGPAPVQVLAILDQDGKLVITWVQPPPSGPAPVDPALPGAPRGGGGGGLPAAGGVLLPGSGPPSPVAQWVGTQKHQYDLDTVQILDTNANKIDRKEVTQRFKKEIVAMASWSGPVDPLHLRVLRDGMLTIILPHTRGAGTPPAPAGRGFRPGRIGAPPAPGGLPAVPSQPMPPRE